MSEKMFVTASQCELNASCGSSAIDLEFEHNGHHNAIVHHGIAIEKPDIGDKFSYNGYFY